MPGETILVVDDTILILKLIATVLRNDGYKVQLASTAEQALTTLNTLRPDLVLTDIRLPGMDGLALTRHIRRQVRLQGVVVVAMTASAREGIAQEALDAGCDGFITKPVEPKALGTQIHNFLKGEEEKKESAGQDAPQFTLGRFSLSSPETETLRRAFLEEALRENRELLSSLDARFDAGMAKQILYRWIGTAGLLGYEAISQGALAMEALVAAMPPNKAQLRESLTNMMFALQEASKAANTPLPDSMLRELAKLRVALVGFADAEADRLCGALERVGSRPRLFQIDDPQDCDSVTDCNVVMVHVRAENMGSPWLAAEAPSLAMPLILVGAREQILALDTAVQCRAKEFLIDGWQPEEALMRLRFALPSFAGAEAAPRETIVSPEVPAAPIDATSAGGAPREGSRRKVLLAEDDEIIRKLVEAVLRNDGIDSLLASTGAEALQMAVEHRPRVALLDVNMPGMDGFQVLAEIRRQNVPTHVLMLTSRQQEHDIVRGFELGADDYVVKPFNSRELTMRVRRLLLTEYSK